MTLPTAGRPLGSPSRPAAQAHRLSQATFYSWRKRLGSRRTAATPIPAFAAARVVSDPTVDVVLPSGLVVREVRKAPRRQPWAYIRHILTASADARAGEFSDLLPDAWAQAGACPLPVAN